MMDKPSTGFSLKSSIPVLRMLDESKAKSFYLDYLGYLVDWEHRFSDTLDSPLYMQIHHGDSVLHLNGHADSDSAVCEVRIPVGGLEQYCGYLVAKETVWEKPELVDPRGVGHVTETNLLDPSGNHLVFWSPTWNASK
jgi:hypothetical protein